MTSAGDNDLMPTQEKLEWVTPKISLMEAGETAGNKKNNFKEINQGRDPPNHLGIIPAHTNKNQ
ncbi:MAG: hypothetical protein NTV57_09975 [Cyanobacteria bacterium]|nr:hypothetical protein [Cyanobacteriota bacterium]